jgi:hypothetical protein
VYEPPFATTGKILPHASALPYWEQRIGLGPLTGCYNEIAAQIAPHLPALLARTDWSRCERRILQSWQSDEAA